MDLTPMRLNETMDCMIWDYRITSEHEVNAVSLQSGGKVIFIRLYEYKKIENKVCHQDYLIGVLKPVKKDSAWVEIDDGVLRIRALKVVPEPWHGLKEKIFVKRAK